MEEFVVWIDGSIQTCTRLVVPQQGVNSYGDSEKWIFTSAVKDNEKEKKDEFIRNK